MSTEVGSLNASLTLDMSNFQAGISEAASMAAELGAQLRSAFNGDIGMSQMITQVQELMESVKLLRAEMTEFAAQQNSMTSADIFAKMKAVTATLPADLAAIQSGVQSVATAADMAQASIDGMAISARDAVDSLSGLNLQGLMPDSPIQLDFSEAEAQLDNMLYMIEQIISGLQSMGSVDLSTGEFIGGDWQLVVSNLVDSFGEVSAALDTILGQLADAIQATREWSEELQKVADRLNASRAATNGTRQAATGTQKPLKQAAQQAANFGKKVDGANKALQSAKGYALSVKGIIGGIVVSQAFYTMLGYMQQLVNGAKEFSATLQDAGTAFKYLLAGQDTSGGAFINALQEISLKSPLDLTDLTAASRKLMAMGFSAKATVPTLQILTDTAAVFSNTAGDMASQIDHIALAFGQMLAAGKVSAQELRQLYNAGLPIYELLSKGMGITMEEAKRAGSMNLDSATAIYTILMQLNERYGGAAKDMASNFSGACEVIKVSLQQMLAYAWDPAFQALTNQLAKLSKYIQALARITQAYGIGGLFQALIPKGLWGPLRTIIGALMQLGSAIKDVGIIFRSVFGTMLNLMAQVGQVVIPIISLIAKVITTLAIAALKAAPIVRYLLATLLMFVVVTKIIAIIRWLAKSIWMLTGAATAAAAVKHLITAFLALPMAAKIAIGVLLAIAAAFLAIVASSEKAKAAIKAFFGKAGDAIAGLGESLGIGFDPNDIVMPEFKPPEMDDFSDGLKDLIDGFKDLGDEEDDAAKKAKKLKNNLQSFDEVYLIEEPDDDDNGLGDMIGDLQGLLNGFGDLSWDDMFDWTGDWATDWGKLLADLDGFGSDLGEGIGELFADGLADIQKFLDDLFGGLTGGLEAFDALMEIADMVAAFLALFGNLKWAGALEVAAGIAEVVHAIRDIAANGVNLDNLMELVHGLGRIVTGFGLITGNIDFIGIGLMIQGISEVVTALKNIIVDGIDIKGICDVIEGITKITAGLGFLTGNFKLAGISLFIHGLTTVFEELATNWEAIMKGDWSGVDKIALITGAIEMIGGLLLALEILGKLRGATRAMDAVEATREAADAVGGVSDTVSGSLSPRLSSLAKNFGLVLVIILEVAAAAALIVGAIALLGLELQLVQEAWTPILENSDGIIEACLLGVAILGSVGLAMKALGEVGTDLIKDLALGMAILAEVSAGADLFLLEVAALGIILQKVGEAWEPVIQNAGTVETAVLIGTGILAAIAVAMDLLGGAGKDLIAKMALGAAILAEVSVATDLFLAELLVIGLLLQEVVDAWKPVLDDGETALTAFGLGTAILAAVGVATAALGAVGTSLAGYILAGMLILVELGAAAALFIAEIWIIGELLQQVVDAWGPVLAEGDVAAEAIGLGTAILLAVGAACALLGVAAIATVGLLPLAILAGMGMLVEVGAAAVLFIAEVAEVGSKMGEMVTAWGPVLAQGDAASQAIEKGTDLLLGVGAACAALGAASILSVGLLPVAIALGTWMLEEVKDATIDFIKSIGEVIGELGNLIPKLARVNEQLPQAEKDMNSFVNFMTKFAEAAASYEKSMGSLTWSNIVDGFLKFFTGSPIDNLASSIATTTKELSNLNSKLEPANTELKRAVELMKDYNKFMNELKLLVEEGDGTTLKNGMLTNLKEVGQALVTGLIDGIKSKTSEAQSAVKDLGAKIEQEMNNYKSKYTQSGKDAANALISGFKDGITSGMASMTQHLSSAMQNPITSWLTTTFNSNNFTTYGQQVIQGVKQGITNEMSSMTAHLSSMMQTPIKTWLTSTFASTNYTSYGQDMVKGIKTGITSEMVSMASHLTTAVQTPMKNWLTTTFAATNYNSYGKQLVQGIKQGMTTEMSSMTSHLTSTIQTPIKNWLTSSFAASNFTTYGQQMINGIKQGITSGMSSMTSHLQSTILTPLKNWLNINFAASQFTQYGKNIPDGIQTGLKQNISKFVPGSLNSDLLNPTKSFFSTNFAASNWTIYGSYIVDGICKGISDNAYKVRQQAQALAKEASNTIQNSLQIHSPSKITTKFGEFVDEGLVVGMANELGAVGKMASNVADAVTNNLAMPDVELPEFSEIPTFSLEEPTAASLDGVRTWSANFISIMQDTFDGIEGMFNDLNTNLLNTADALNSMPTHIEATITPLAATEQLAPQANETPGTQETASVLARLDEESIRLLATMTAEKLYEFLAPMLANMDQEDQEAIVAYVGTLIADERSLKQLERKLSIIRSGDERRRS